MSRLATEIHINDGPALDGELTIEQKAETVWSRGPRPDPLWTYTDHQGHEHQYVKDGDWFTTPTLRVEREHVPCDGTCGDSGCEGYSIPHYFCVTCGEEIEPGLLHGPYQFTINMGYEWSVTVRALIGQLDEDCQVSVVQGETIRSGTARVVSQEGWRSTTGVRDGRSELVGVSELSEARAGAAGADPGADLNVSTLRETPKRLGGNPG